MTDRYQRWNDWAPRYIADLMHDFGLLDWQASSFPGNGAPESGYFNSLQEINPIVAGSRGGLGHFQWTGPRRVTFEALMKKRGWKVDSYEANYTMLFLELKGAYSYLVDDHDPRSVKTAPTIDTATWRVCKYYEGPRVINLAPRVKAAKEALALYKAHPVQPTVWGGPKPTHEEITPMPTPVPTTPADPPALPWFKSPVFVSALVALAGGVWSAIQLYKPGVPISQQLDTLMPPIFAAIAGLFGAVKRATATAQPLTGSQSAADAHAEKVVPAQPVQEFQPATTFPVPAQTVPLETLPLNQLVHELPQVLNLIGALLPQFAVIGKIATEVQKIVPEQPPRV